MTPGLRIEQQNGEVTLHVELPAEAIQEREKQLLAEIAERVQVPGFRPGKAPTHLVLRYYGEDTFLTELKEDLVHQAATEAIKASGLKPLSTPTVEGIQFARGQPLSFRLKFAVLPPVQLPEKLDLKLPELPPPQVSDAEVEAVLADLRRDAAVLEPKDGPAEEGDVVRIRRGKQMWEGEARSSAPLGKQLLGAQAGQRVTLTSESGQGQDFEVAGVYRMIIPSLEEAAGHYGQPSWEALREEVRKELLKQAEENRREAERRACLDALADQLHLEVPPSLLKERVEEEMEEMGLRAEMRGEVEAALKKRLRRELAARLVAEAQHLVPSEAEVRQLAQALDRTEEEVRGRWVFERAADWLLAQIRRQDEAAAL